MLKKLLIRLKNLTMFDYLLWGSAFFVVFSSAPMWIKLYQKQGKPAPSFTVLDADRSQKIFPTKGEKQILIFWATWCGPCEIELSRFNAAVKEGEISKDKIVAISLGEEPDLVFTESLKRNYQFRVAADPHGDAGNVMEVSGTPTVFHIDSEGKVAYASSGISPLTIQRAKSFLN